MIEIAQNIFWDNDKPYWEQSPEAQELANDAVKLPPINQEFEACDGGNKRPILKVFTIGEKHLFKVEYSYINTPYSSEWAGVQNKTTEVYGT